MSSKIDLSKVPLSKLRAEIARRELASGKRGERPSEKIRRAKWVCPCGNEVQSGGDFTKVRVDYGRVWCMPCTNGGYINLYGSNGKPASIPMKEIALDE